MAFLELVWVLVCFVACVLPFGIWFVYCFVCFCFASCFGLRLLVWFCLRLFVYFGWFMVKLCDFGVALFEFVWFIS